MTEIILETLFENIQNEVEFKQGKIPSKEDFEIEWKNFYEKAKLNIEKQLAEYQMIYKSRSISKYNELIKMSYAQFSELYYKSVKDKFLALGLIDKNTHVNDWENNNPEIKYQIKVIYNFLIKSKCSASSLAEAKKMDISIRKNMMIKSSAEYLGEVNQVMFESLKDNKFGQYALKGWELFHYDENNQLDIVRFLAEVKKEVYNVYLPYYNLIETTKKYLSKEQLLQEGSFNTFIDWKVNIGSRTYHREGYNNERLISTIKVQQNGNTFEYEDRKDGKSIRGIYTKIMLHAKNEIIVLNVGEEKMINRTVYKVPGQIQRTDLVNDNKIELHMHKHFDPEVIYFDDYDEAKAFQDKLEAKRQNRNNSRRA